MSRPCERRTADTAAGSLGAVTFNNFYEFTTVKDKLWQHVGKLKTQPWEIEIGGLCKQMPALNGWADRFPYHAPLRLVVPWKYGYKSAKSIVKISFVEKQPQTFWNMANPTEYGFFSNVNPKVHHPRWSQAREWMIPDTLSLRDTVLFDGYGEQAASL